MIPVSHKAKQFLVLAVKLLIVGAAFYFIYHQLARNEKLDWEKFTALLQAKLSFWNLSLVLSLSFLNRFLEILKWQNLVTVLKRISLGVAAKQVLGSLTAGLFTPNGIGEFAGKALFFEKSNTKKIIFLNLVGNGIQMVLTVVFGIFGLLYFNTVFEVITPKAVISLFIVVIMILCLLFFVKKLTVKGYSLEKLIRKINEIPKAIHRKNILLGIGRYLAFSHQYYILFLFFGVDSPYFLLMAAITSVYFVASSLPTFQFLDFAVKGSVAVYFFGLMGINEWIVVFISTLMWFLNTVVPSVIGSYFVLNYKAPWNP
ncbi:lysylphosphatidylglycerol synthase domain-containing protein [Flavobacterium humi]|uniref:Flippase-like domain-containing protein n=1 Tax=Flavobacterium humi TaxID=2562683 RepID=A0A4Z0L5A5_9FLAO|nr:lysylphosphatidylglycerol synthase domain-containing protein [Flavobacterium humi]TGD57671.1 hypothetical protein E4635_10820 [Flavobacterium humi]